MCRHSYGIYKVENDDDSADDIDDGNSSGGTNKDNDSDEESKSNIKDEDDAFSPTTMKRKYSPALVSPATENKSHGNNVKVSLDKLYPNLSCALGGDNGFDPTDPSVQKSMLSLIDLLSTTYQLDVTELSNNKKIFYVKVPRTTSDRSFVLK
jgi:hypothetical protein